MSHFRLKEFCAVEATREQPGVEELRLERWAQAQNTKRFESPGNWAAPKREGASGVPQRLSGVQEAVAPAK